MLITIVFNIKFPAYQSRKCCQNRFNFSDITSLIWHPCVTIVFKNWTNVQSEKVDKEVYFLRI